MILNIIATLLICGLVLHQAYSSLQVWGGPYEEKGKYMLISVGIIIGAVLTMLAVWL